MSPILCVIGGCNGAGKTTLARELVPRMGILRFLNADELARGLSPLNPAGSAFRAGRLLIDETRTLLEAGSSFALESTLSGKTHVALLQTAKTRGYRVVLHYVRIDSAAQAVLRVALRVLHGGHDVPERDVLRRFERSKRHFVEDYLPLADEWVVWDNAVPPPRRMADNNTHRAEEIKTLLDSSKIQESPTQGISKQIPEQMPEAVRLGLEAGRAATAKMLDYYRRMGIEVTPQMTLAAPPDPESEAARSVGVF